MSRTTDRTTSEINPGTDPDVGPGTGPTASPAPARTGGESEWWRHAVTYQLYIKSFADGDGDGMGDVAGIIDRLPYLARLGVDAVWINPWYPSPQVDGGYDVADYRDLDPAFGSLADGERLIGAAHEHGLKVILDIVPNHTSDAHPWFQAALAAGPGSAERARYIFRPGRGVGGAEPPNDWRSVFGGSAWGRVTEPDGSPGEWYLHLFDARQPDLDWTNPEVRDEFTSILRFWFDRGADGFRIDVAHGLAKNPTLPDLGLSEDAILASPRGPDHPHWDRPEVHPIYREWRAVADAYDPPRAFVAEAWVSSPERLADYLRPDELHTAFDFDMVRAPWDAAALRATIDASMSAQGAVGAPVTWVLSNHDITRHVTRFGQLGETSGDTIHGGRGAQTDLATGTRRARAAILLELALPGATYLYQGEELGLPEVEDLPEDLLQDPVWERSGRTERGRDGCRVPIPWERTGPSFGFGAGPGWLPQPAGWGELSVQAQDADPGSMLNLYREALRLRRELPALGAGDAPMEWLEDLPEGVIGFRRGAAFALVVNAGTGPVALPAELAGRIVLGSAPLDRAGRLPADAAVWIVPE